MEQLNLVMNALGLDPEKGPEYLRVLLEEVEKADAKENVIKVEEDMNWEDSLEYCNEHFKTDHHEFRGHTKYSLSGGTIKAIHDMGRKELQMRKTVIDEDGDETMVWAWIEGMHNITFKKLPGGIIETSTVPEGIPFAEIGRHRKSKKKNSTEGPLFTNISTIKPELIRMTQSKKNPGRSEGPEKFIETLTKIVIGRKKTVKYLFGESKHMCEEPILFGRRMNDLDTPQNIFGSGPGLTTPYYYISPDWSLFSMHEEDFHGTNSVSIHVFGEDKVWVFIPVDQYPLFIKMATQALQRINGDYPECIVLHKQHFYHPFQLSEWGIRYTIAIQRVGDMIVTSRNAFHEGVNVGMGMAVAVNFAAWDYMANCHNSRKRLTCSGSRNKGSYPCVHVNLENAAYDVLMKIQPLYLTGATTGYLTNRYPGSATYCKEEGINKEKLRDLKKQLKDLLEVPDPTCIGFSPDTNPSKKGASTKKRSVRFNPKVVHSSDQPLTSDTEPSASGSKSSTTTIQVMPGPSRSTRSKTAHTTNSIRPIAKPASHQKTLVPSVSEDSEGIDKEHNTSQTTESETGLELLDSSNESLFSLVTPSNSAGVEQAGTSNQHDVRSKGAIRSARFRANHPQKIKEDNKVAHEKRMMGPAEKVAAYKVNKGNQQKDRRARLTTEERDELNKTETKKRNEKINSMSPDTRKAYYANKAEQKRLQREKNKIKQAQGRDKETT